MTGRSFGHIELVIVMLAKDANHLFVPIERNCDPYSDSATSGALASFHR
jgi:hypothetical protein